MNGTEDETIILHDDEHHNVNGNVDNNSNDSNANGATNGNTNAEDAYEDDDYASSEGMPDEDINFTLHYAL